MKTVWIILQVIGALIFAAVIIEAFYRDINKWLHRNWLYVYSATALSRKDSECSWTESSFNTTSKLNCSSIAALRESIKRDGQYDTVIIANVIYLGRVKPQKKERKP